MSLFAILAVDECTLSATGCVFTCPAGSTLAFTTKELLNKKQTIRIVDFRISQPPISIKTVDYIQNTTNKHSKFE
jgi:hypothetical protein